jgi:formamidopyrimidine-DNA glycosylase
MPELPDVEHYRRVLAEHGTGRRIERVLTMDEGILRGVDGVSLDRALRGSTFAEPERHGKWLIAWTTGPAVLIHFGMTGDLIPGRGPNGRHRHDRVVFELDRGELRYRNMRKLGGVWLAHDRGEVDHVLGGLGPDALGMDRRAFRHVLERRRGGVKAALMDQTFVAGVGNLLADEILWQARLHPARRIEGFGPDERERLFDAFRKVVRTWANRFPDVPARWLIHVRGRPGARCPRCHTELDRTDVAGRTTWFCPLCQPPPPVH